MLKEQGLEEKLKQVIVSETKNLLEKYPKHLTLQEWFSLTDGAKYTGVSYNTFMKFRTLGLKVCEIDGIKRVSRKEIDRFLEEHSF